MNIWDLVVHRVLPLKVTIGKSLFRQSHDLGPPVHRTIAALAS
jgi:hypothetical protein